MLFRQIQIKQRIWPIQKLQPHIQDEPCNEPTATFSNPTNPQKSKPSGFIVGDSMIKKVVGYLLTRSLKYQYLVKTKPFSTAKNLGHVRLLKTKSERL